MATYVLLSQIQPGAFADPRDFKKLAADVSRRIKDECPEVKWTSSFATMGGQCDVVDVIESDNPNQVEKAAMIIRSHGHSNTETMVATPWKQFIESL